MSRQELTRLGLVEVFRDHQERIRFQRDWIAELGDFSLAPEELIDLGEGGVFVSGADRRQRRDDRSWVRELLGPSVEGGSHRVRTRAWLAGVSSGRGL
jgi:hypothetical protein